MIYTPKYFIAYSIFHYLLENFHLQNGKHFGTPPANGLKIETAGLGNDGFVTPGVSGQLSIELFSCVPFLFLFSWHLLKQFHPSPTPSSLPSLSISLYPPVVMDFPSHPQLVSSSLQDAPPSASQLHDSFTVSVPRSDPEHSPSLM